MATTREENEMMTRVARGTPAGEMLRRYWWPVGFTEEVQTGGVPVPARLLGEDLVLFRDGQGKPGVLGRHCSHRGTSLEYGRVEEAGIRCPYHGWLYATNGRCLEQPAEPEDSTYKDRIQHLAYPAQDLGGLLFAYLGPEPAPLLPRYDLLVREDGRRTVSGNVDYCNWLQRGENSVDQGHLPSLHASGYPQWALSRPEVRWERTWFGIQATSRIQGETEEKISLYLFPSNNRFTSARTYGEPGHHLGFRVPIDDEETITFSVAWYPDPEGKASGLTTRGLKRSAWGVYTPVDNGWWRVVEEDRMAAEQQGRIADRTVEHLASSDRGVIMLREMVREAIDTVQEGGDPPGVVRDPAQNVCIAFDAKMTAIGSLA